MADYIYFCNIFINKCISSKFYGFPNEKISKYLVTITVSDSETVWYDIIYASYYKVGCIFLMAIRSEFDIRETTIGKTRHTLLIYLQKFAFGASSFYTRPVIFYLYNIWANITFVYHILVD